MHGTMNVKKNAFYNKGKTTDEYDKFMQIDKKRQMNRCIYTHTYNNDKCDSKLEHVNKRRKFFGRVRKANSDY